MTCDSSDGGTTRSATDTTSPITVSALTNGSTYAFAVVATNSVGDDAASDPSDDVVAVTTPDAPTITSLTRGSNSAIVAFNPPADGGDAIVFYKATCTSTTGGNDALQDGTELAADRRVAVERTHLYLHRRRDQLDRRQRGLRRDEPLRRGRLPPRPDRERDPR